MTRLAKQSAQQAYPTLGIVLFHFEDCLAPDFFLMSIFSWSSATSISVLSALIFIWASSSAFFKASASAVLIGLDFLAISGSVTIQSSTFSSLYCVSQFRICFSVLIL